MNIELSSLKGKKVLVVGDLMLDSYHIGEVKRISPEAPVPVVRINRTYNVLGGAANVARNLLGLGCVPYVIGLLGNDQNGTVMQDMFSELGIHVDLDVTEYPTITKTRILGNSQQIIRIDFEPEKGFMTQQNEQRLLAAIRKTIPLVDVVIISDYGKGVCNSLICKNTISISSEYGKRVVVDPKGTNWDKYRDAMIVTPNLNELAQAAGVPVKNEDNIVHEVAEGVIEQYNLTSLLVTRSEKGMSYIDACTAKDIPTEAKEVYDVSGAGDTVVATLAASLAAGFVVMDAIYLANKAAGIVVGKMGTSPILFNELQSELLLDNSNSKIVPMDQLPDLIRLLRMQHRKIVFTNGCFDILHKGHVVYLEKARKMGDVLIVGVNADSSVKRLKGNSRPVNDQEARCCVLAALGYVDYVILFSEDTPLDLIKEIAPDILVKGGDYALSDVVGKEYAKQTVVVPFVDGYSTSKTIDALKG